MSADIRSRLRFAGDVRSVDTRATPGGKQRKSAEKDFARDAAELATLQERLYAESERALVLAVNLVAYGVLIRRLLRGA